MSERSANSMAKQINRSKELKEELQKVKETLAEKEEELAKMADVSGIELLLSWNPCCERFARLPQ